MFRPRKSAIGERRKELIADGDAGYRSSVVGDTADAKIAETIR